MARSVIHTNSWLVVLLVVGGGVSAARAQSACLQSRVEASNGGVFDSFGYGVAVNGDFAIVGAIWEDSAGIDAGAAYVFQSGVAGWTQTQMLTPRNLGADDHFGRTISIDGDWAFVSATAQVSPNGGSGTVYAYRFDGAEWVEIQELFASNGESGDNFGHATALDGDVAVIGAPSDDDFGPSSGSAYVFQRSEDLWVEVQQLHASDAAANSGFGVVSLSGDRIAIGAPGADVLQGAVYVFQKDALAGHWEEQQVLTLPTDDGYILGDAVVMEGDWLTAHFQAPNGVVVFRFDRAASMFVHVQTVLAPPGDSGSFGRAIALEGDTLLVGSWNSDVFGPSDGAAYVYRLEGDQWQFEAVLGPQPNPWTSFFGWSVALDGETALVGAHGEDGQAGAAYFFDLSAAGKGDLDCQNCVGVEDLGQLLAAWGLCESRDCPADISPPGGNGMVNAADLAAILAAWGECP